MSANKTRPEILRLRIKHVGNVGNGNGRTSFYSLKDLFRIRLQSLDCAILSNSTCTNYLIADWKSSAEIGKVWPGIIPTDLELIKQSSVNIFTKQRKANQIFVFLGGRGGVGLIKSCRDFWFDSHPPANPPWKHEEKSN